VSGGLGVGEPVLWWGTREEGLIDRVHAFGVTLWKLGE
jgi:hypothetical protein